MLIAGIKAIWRPLASCGMQATQHDPRFQTRMPQGLPAADRRREAASRPDPDAEPAARARPGPGSGPGRPVPPDSGPCSRAPAARRARAYILV